MASIILGVGVGVCSLSQAQVGGGMGGAMPNVPGAAFGGGTDPSSIQVVNGLRIIPSVQVSERYDSNVFSASKRQLQGLTPEDFVTTIVPQLRGLYTDRRELVKVNAMVGAVGSYYANNTGLSYVGANAGTVLDMSDLMSKWRPGTRWTVSDTFFYSPEPPAFLLGGQLGEPANLLVAGFQASRTKTNSNSFNTIVELPLDSTVKLTGSYTNSFIRYGASQVPRTISLLSQDVQAYSAGLLVQVSLQDTVRVDFIGNEFDQGSRGAFSLRGGAIVWTHILSNAASFNATGGVQELSGESNGIRFSSVIAPFGSLALRWKDPTTSISLVYRSSITPSFQFQSAVLLNHLVLLEVSQSTPIPDLSGLLRANYSVANEYGSNSGGGLSWTTVGGTAGLLYRATQKTFLTLTYEYQNVDNVFGGAHFAYDRHVIQLSLAQAFY